MKLPYTHFKSSDGWFVGYWNDYPDYSTQGKTLRELHFMLRDLRKCINDMLSNGEIPASTLLSGVIDIPVFPFHSQNPKPPAMNNTHLTQIAQVAAGLSCDASMAECVVKHERATRFVSALADRRARSGLTQKDIAARMGVSVSTISRLEDSCDADVRLGDLISYANAVGINISLLMKDSPLP